jgi:hypothetical protein
MKRTASMPTVTYHIPHTAITNAARTGSNDQILAQYDYTYDDRGNLSHDDGYDNTNSDHFAYEYDLNNQLTEVSYDPGTGLTALATYRYDGLGPS